MALNVHTRFTDNEESKAHGQRNEQRSVHGNACVVYENMEDISVQIKSVHSSRFGPVMNKI